MKQTDITRRLAGLGSDKWDVHRRARKLSASGRHIIELTIGEPDITAPTELVDVACDAMRRGRTTYSSGQGEFSLRSALAEHYSKKSGRPIGAEQILCFPGTQTALFAVLMGVAEAGDEVLVGDPFYATYEGLIRATGADLSTVPLRPENGFRMRAADVKERLTPRTRAILLTTPHNPTGAIMTSEDLRAIGELALQHDFWIVSDEVYAALTFDGSDPPSPLSLPEIADRTIVASSISKSHAAPGFRSGWCVGPAEFAQSLLPLSETMLFGNPPFTADMTEQAVRQGSTVAAGMSQRYAARAAMLKRRLDAGSDLEVHPPEAGMFAMVDISATGLDGQAYALDLLETQGVAVMPGSSFGEGARNWVRIALTVDDNSFGTACDRIVTHAQNLRKQTP